MGTKQIRFANNNRRILHKMVSFAICTVVLILILLLFIFFNWLCVSYSQVVRHRCSYIMDGEKVAKNNIFSIMMASSASKGKSFSRSNNKSSKFVPCPICNINIVESNINNHLDLCMKKDNNDDSNSFLGCKRPLVHIKNANENIIDNGKRAKMEQNHINNNNICNNVENRLKNNEKSKTDIFSQMMSNSMKLHKKHIAKTYRFHLYDTNGNVKWFCSNTGNDTKGEKIDFNDEKWKATVFIKGAESGEKDELIISTSIPSIMNDRDPSLPEGVFVNQSKQLVKYPSKLSVS